MARDNNPLKPLRNIAKPLLRAFFGHAKVLQDLPWDDLKETDDEVIYRALKELPGDIQAPLQRALEDIDELSDSDGSQAMAEQLARARPDMIDEFNGVAGHASRAMWVYLNHPATFRVAASFAEAAHLARGRSWVKRDGLPIPIAPDAPFVYTSEMDERFRKAIEALHKPEVRGEGCKVRHISRGNGAEYFFVTMNDYSHIVPVWRDGVVVDALAFSEFGHTFVYTPSAGTLEIHAKGGKPVNGPLHRIFGKAVLDVDLSITDPIKPSYTLDHLLKRGRKLGCDPLDPVKAPRLTRLVLGSKDHDCEPITVEANPELGPKRIDEVLDRLLREEVRGPEHWTVLAARFHLDLKPEAKKRHPTMQFSVTRHSCDLRSRPDEVRAWGERTMQRSGVSFG
jgi:hypothetical protein